MLMMLAATAINLNPHISTPFLITILHAIKQLCYRCYGMEEKCIQGPQVLGRSKVVVEEEEGVGSNTIFN